MIALQHQIAELRAVMADRDDASRFTWEQLSDAQRQDRRTRLAAAAATLEFLDKHGATMRALAREAQRLAATPQMAAVLAAFPNAEVSDVRSSQVEPAAP